MAVVGQRLQTLLHVVTAVVEGFAEAGLELHLYALPLVEVRIPDDRSLVVGLRSRVILQRILCPTHDGHRQRLRIVVRLRVVAHAAASGQRLLAH